MADLLPSIPSFDVAYDRNDSENSAYKIVYAVKPSWKSDKSDNLQIKTFTEGITNTMLKISNPSEPDSNPIVMRAFGPGAEPLTSRPREVALHAMLSKQDLAPRLLARFRNGMAYSFTSGSPCDSARLHEERVWRGVARQLGYWHASLPVGVQGTRMDAADSARTNNLKGQIQQDKQVAELAREHPPGDMWAVMRRWADRMPEANDKEKQLKRDLKEEVEWAFAHLHDLEGLGGQNLVQGHCDLLAGNVLVQDEEKAGEPAQVQFIDYEYSVACHAAFDIALHFGEWSGFECDYTQTPGQAVRRAFVKEYVSSWNASRPSSGRNSKSNEADEVDHMVALVDRFRGIPGLWFALWGFVQAHDSSEEFDYRKYAETRLRGEYHPAKRWEEMGRPEGGAPGQPDSEGMEKSSPDVREAYWWK